MIENKNTFDSDFIPKNCHHIEIISQISDISMDDEWYEIATEAHFWLEWRLRAMLQQINQLNIPINQKLKALEVGCGSGILRQSIESTTNWDVDAADLNIKALSKVKTGRGKTILYNIFDENKSLIELYDVVILYDVLEHIKSTRPFIESLMKHIKPNGYLLINVPALNTLFSIYDAKMGHFRRYNKKSLISEFNEFNLEIKDIRYWGFSMLPMLIIRSCLMTILNKNDNNIIKRGFKPPNELVNKIFLKIAQLETRILSRPLLGTSLLLAGQK